MANANDSSFVQPAIPRFDGHYDHWSMLMENFLRSKEYWSLVETGFEDSEKGSAASEDQKRKRDEMKLKDLQVKNYLFQAIDRTILETILQKNTSKEIWDSMKRKYEGNARVKRSILQGLRKEFEILEMKSGESITDYFSRVMSVASKMRTYGEQMQDVIIVEKILRSLTEKFNYIVFCSIEESKDIDSLSIDELQSSLIVHEQKFHKKHEEEQALKVSSEDNGGRGRGSYRGRGRQNRATIECFKCHKLEHYKNECPDWDKEAHYAAFNEEEELLLMADEDLHGVQTTNAWFLDSGCSNHMCGNRAWFKEVDDTFKQHVKLGNNTRMEVTGKGSVRLNIKGVTHIITDVFLVPELKNNLLSIGQLQEKGLTVMFQSGTCKLYHPDKGLILETNMTTNRMFILFAQSATKKDSCFHISTQDLSSLWHRRYAHLSHKRTKNFTK
uniref:Retrovirus-related Pol polyprotein from transposon TNT 1-94 n=1 Tax=Cajanus cajan TaxID=3821 RepID=A0A151S692_CAJCA|nr:Retrovirus-related Pol polyprotein from transposon TNT 1-94 [Cajanus cajan]